MEDRGDLVLVFDVLEKRSGVGAVAAGVVRRGPAGPHRIGDDRAGRTLHLGEAPRDGCAPRQADGALEFIDEQIVAARVEHQDAQVLGLLQIGKDFVDSRHAPQIRFVALAAYRWERGS